MLIRIRETGQLVSVEAFKAMYPNTSFTPQISVESLNNLGADVVLSSPIPDLQEGQSATISGAELIDGNWYTTYSIQG